MVKLKTSEYLKAADLDGDTTVEFVDEGRYVDSSFKDDAGNTKQNFNITIKFGDTEKSWSMNKTSQRTVAEAYGNDTDQWVGQTAILKKVQMMVGKEMRDVIMGEPASAKLEPEGWTE